MKKFFDMEIDGQVELENGKTIGELKESNISITDPDVSGGGADAIIKYDGSQTFELLSGDFNAVAQKLLTDKDVKIVLSVWIADDEYNETEIVQVPCCVKTTVSNVDPTGIAHIKLYPVESNIFYFSGNYIGWDIDGSIEVH